MKTLHEFHDMLTNALDAIEEAKGAEERKANAQRRFNSIVADSEVVAAAAAKARADAAADVAQKNREVDELRALMEREHADHAEAMKKAAADAKAATDAASETLEGINRQIAEGRAELEKLMTAKARIRAEIADALKDGE